MRIRGFVLVTSVLAGCGHASMRADGKARYVSPDDPMATASLYAEKRSEGGHRGYMAYLTPTDTGVEVAIEGSSNEESEVNPDRWRVWIEDGRGGKYEAVAQGDSHAASIESSKPFRGREITARPRARGRKEEAGIESSPPLRNDTYAGEVVLAFDVPAYVARDLTDLTVALETPSNSVRFHWTLIKP